MVFRFLIACAALVVLAAAPNAWGAPQQPAAHGRPSHSGSGGEHPGAAGQEVQHEPLGASGASADPSELKGDLAIYTFFVFLLLLLILWRFAWGPISAGLDKREQRIADQIAAAERSHEDAKRMLADYEQKLALAHEEVRAILDEARRDAEHTQQEIVAKARADAQAEMARGRREIETATAQALKELAETSANLAVELAGKIVKSQLKPADHARLIEEALARFPQDDPRRN